MGNKNLVLGVVVVVVLSLALAGLSQLSKLSSGVAGLVSAVSKGKLGAFPGTEFTSPFLTVNGITKYSFSSALNSASTTICSFRTPAATSTLAHASWHIRTGTTTAIVLDVGQSTLMDATTTKLGVTYALGSFEQATVVASTTESVRNFSPNTYLNFKFGGTRGAANVLAGSCKAEFIVY